MKLGMERGMRMRPMLMVMKIRGNNTSPKGLMVVGEPDQDQDLSLSIREEREQRVFRSLLVICHSVLVASNSEKLSLTSERSTHVR